VEIKTFPDALAPVNIELEALMRNVKEQIEKLVSFGKVILLTSWWSSRTSMIRASSPTSPWRTWG